MSDELNEIDVLFPKEHKIVVKEKGGEEIIIKPFMFMQVFKVIGVIAKIAEEIAKKGNESEALFKFLTESEDKVMQILTIATGKPKEWFEDLEGDTGFDIVTAVWDSNKSFFDNKVSPLLEKMGFSQKVESLNSPKEEVQEILTDEEVEKILNASLNENLQVTDGLTQ